jgi:regulator of protease activity HflC (stomatin/prohibitin superfamily)
MSALLCALLFVVLPAVMALKSIKIVQTDQRLLVERLGRFHRVCEPGRHLVLPFVEKAHLIRLNDTLPEWTGLSETRIQERVARTFYGAER